MKRSMLHIYDVCNFSAKHAVHQNMLELQYLFANMTIYFDQVDIWNKRVKDDFIILIEKQNT